MFTQDNFGRTQTGSVTVFCGGQSNPKSMCQIFCEGFLQCLKCQRSKSYAPSPMSLPKCNPLGSVSEWPTTRELTTADRQTKVRYRGSIRHFR